MRSTDSTHPELTEVIIGFENVLNVIRCGFTMVEKVLDNFWDAKFVSIFPVYFADGVKEASSLLLDTLWEKAIPARIKIRQIELGNELEFTRSISSNEVRDILMDLIECSVKSILIFLPGHEAVKWFNEQRVFEGLHVAILRGIEVRIIMDQAASNRYFEKWFKRFSIQFLLSSVRNTHLDIIVDYKFTLSIYPNVSSNDNKVGTYSNIEARAMVSSSIFENYWIKSTCLK